MVEITDDAFGMYNKYSQIKFKSSMLKSNFCDYSYAYILISGTITVSLQAGDNQNNINKEISSSI